MARMLPGTDCRRFQSVAQRQRQHHGSPGGISCWRLAAAWSRWFDDVWSHSLFRDVCSYIYTLPANLTVLIFASHDYVCVGYDSKVELTSSISGQISGVSKQHQSLTHLPRFTARLCDTGQKGSILFDFQNRPSCDVLRRPATSCDPRASIRFWWRASAALSSACVIGFLATFTQDRDST